MSEWSLSNCFSVGILKGIIRMIFQDTEYDEAQLVLVGIVNAPSFASPLCWAGSLRSGDAARLFFSNGIRGSMSDAFRRSRTATGSGFRVLDPSIGLFGGNICGR